jgi:hypothetical protein
LIEHLVLEKRRHRRESNTNAEREQREQREQREFFKSPKRRKAAIKATFLCMVPVGGLEPPLPKETDFESVVYTNFTTPASLGYCLSMLGIIRKLFGCARAKD